jgi:hypothetical protein
MKQTGNRNQSASFAFKIKAIRGASHSKLPYSPTGLRYDQEASLRLGQAPQYSPIEVKIIEDVPQCS